jgi:hypothetical protein
MKTIKEYLEKFITQLKKELPGWFIEFNKDYFRIDINKVKSAYPPFGYVTVQIVNETPESEIAKLIEIIKKDIKKKESENEKKTSIIGGRKNEEGSITLTKNGEDLPLKCPGMVSREEMKRAEKEQDRERNRMNIFLTPLNAEGQEGDMSKPNRFVISFMSPEYDPKQYGFEKVEIELDAGAEKGILTLTRGLSGDENEKGVIFDKEIPFGVGVPRVIRKYSFEELCTTPLGIRFDNCVRV